MKKKIQTTARRVMFGVICIFFAYSPSIGRPFDWQYNYVSTPFAVFYNPSHIGNNAGYAFGLDARYLDRENYDGRFALVVPVGDDPARDGSGQTGKGGYNYLTSPYITGRNAVSFGGMYAGGTAGGSYFLTTGFTGPMYTKRLIRGGASVDIAYGASETPAVSLNISAGAPVAGNSLVSLVAHNVFANNRDYGNLFGLSAGAVGLLYSNPYVFSIPYDFQISFYFDEKKVSRTEGIARLSFDLTPMLAGRERTGQTVMLSGGYGFVNHVGKESERKICAALGIVFINRASSAAVLGGYGREEGSYGALMYNLFRESSRSLFAADDISAVLKHSEADSGRIIFTLDCRGANIESWVLRIEGLGDRTVRTFSGGNVVPATVLWDRLDSDGKPLGERESVRARLVVRRKNGAVVESNRVDIEAFKSKK